MWPTTKPPGWPRPELGQAGGAPLGVGASSALWDASSQVTAARPRGRSSGRGARIHVRPGTTTPPGRTPSHGGPARPPAPPPRHSHGPTPPCRRWRRTRLTSHVGTDTWQRRIPDTDPRPRLGPRTTNPRKPRAGHAYFRRPLLALIPALTRRCVEGPHQHWDEESFQHRESSLLPITFFPRSCVVAVLPTFLQTLLLIFSKMLGSAN
ncbi:translation initiation factor IF-2 isoform X2 [Equus asinus]|uniref:translation initiation factor IF-2 isoform X2 n=1 Tax=Equus asinus TaxID=9793 RepID=UPI0038F5E24F